MKELHPVLNRKCGQGRREGLDALGYDRRIFKVRHPEQAALVAAPSKDL
jgi:hypothetical protein